MTYDDMRTWVRVHDLVINRVKVLNVVTEDRFKVTGRGCRWRVDFLDRTVAEWRAYDVRSAEDALTSLSCLYKVLWDCRREGFASFGPDPVAQAIAL